MRQLTAQESAAVRAVPLPASPWCLFLDVDGTLLELAPTPTSVVVEPSLPPLLSRLRLASAGALALVSGRGLADLDQLFAGLALPAAGLHGSERRDARGRMHVAPVLTEALSDVRAELQALAARHAGVMLEDKGAALALHYLGAPELEQALREQVTLMVAPLLPDYTLLEGRAVFEVKPAGHSKDSAVTAFMEEAPFRGRLPVFIGDDFTDYAGFAAVQRFGGMAIAVGPRVTSDWQLPGPRAVHEWLEGLAVRA